MQQQQEQQEQQLPLQPEVHTVQSGVTTHNVVQPQKKDPALFPRSSLGKGIFWCSIIQLVSAVMCLIFDAASIGLANNIHKTKEFEYQTDRYRLIGARATNYYLPVTMIGVGIWTGVFVILVASLGIAAGRSRRNKCLIISHMVLSIISSVMVTGIVVSSLSNINAIIRCDSTISDSIGRYNTKACDDFRWQIFQGLQIVVLLSGIAVAACSITSSVFCCGVSCHKSSTVKRTDQVPTQYIVVYQPQPAGASGYGPNVVVLGQPQTGVPMYGQASDPHQVGASYLSPYPAPSAAQQCLQQTQTSQSATGASAASAAGVEPSNEKPPMYESLE